MTTLPLTPTAAAPQATTYTVGANNEATRHAWVEQTLRTIPAGARLLDAGAGEQRYRPLCAHLNYVSQDFARYDGRGDGTGLQTQAWDQSRLDIVCDITSIPEPDGSFDAVLCTEVFEHLPEPAAALREFARLLKPGGHLILTAPFCSLTHFAPFHFATGFNRYYYKRHLPAHGFEILDVRENGNFFEFVAQELRRTRGVAARYAGESFTAAELAAVHTVLGALQRFSGSDRGSKELLNFGFHVLARKTTPAPQPPATGAATEKKVPAASIPTQPAAAADGWLGHLNSALRATANDKRKPRPKD